MIPGTKVRVRTTGRVGVIEAVLAGGDWVLVAFPVRMRGGKDGRVLISYPVGSLEVEDKQNEMALC